MEEKPIRGWRVGYAEGMHGVHVWFDPNRERLTLRDLTEEEKSVILDKLSSVSGLIRSETPWEHVDIKPDHGSGSVLDQLSLFMEDGDA